MATEFSVQIREGLTELFETHNGRIALGSLAVTGIGLTLFVLLSAADIQWTDTIRRVFLAELGVLFPVGVAFCAAIVLFLVVSPWGSVVFGDQDSDPEFDNLTYFLLIFSATIAAGIALFGPGEATFYLESVPPGISPDADSQQLGEWAMGFTLIHWGFATNFVNFIIAIPVAYYCFRKGAPFRFSSALFPFVRDRRRLAETIDILIVSTFLIAVASSVLEVTQHFLAGISFQWGVVNDRIGTLIFLLAITLVFTTSAVTGLHRGIRQLARLAVLTFVVVVLGVFVFGPTTAIIELAIGATANQPAQFATLAANIQSDWVTTWTILNWALWFSWAAGFGLFFARISYGRSIREFIVYTAVASSVANMVWFYVIGGAVLDTHISGRADILSIIHSQGFAAAGYPMFLSLPAGELFLFLFLGLGLLFLITSMDSVLFSISMTVSADTGSPAWKNRWFWGSVVGSVATIAILLGGIDGTRSLGVVSGFITLVLCVMSMCTLLLSLHRDDHTPDLL